MSNNEIIKKLYYDPQYGFLSAGKLYKKLIDMVYKIYLISHHHHF